jgi:hypothetical protein
MGMSVDELLRAVDDLSESDLESLVNRVRSVRAERHPAVLSGPETALLLKINHGLPEELHQAFLALRDRRDAGTITDAENQQLSDLSDRIENLAADSPKERLRQRAEALMELANLRQMPLVKLMADLEISGPGVR